MGISMVADLLRLFWVMGSGQFNNNRVYLLHTYVIQINRVSSHVAWAESHVIHALDADNALTDLLTYCALKKGPTDRD